MGVGWEVTVSLERGPWHLPGQLAPSGVLGSREEVVTATNYFLNTFDLGPEEFPKIPQLRQDQEWGEMGGGG